MEYLHVILIYTLQIGLLLVALFIIPENRRPSAAMAWLLLIFLIPVLGIVAFLLLGSPKLPKRRRDAERILGHAVVKALDQAEERWSHSNHLLHTEVSQKYSGVSRLAQRLTFLPPFAGNIVQPLHNYEQTIACIIQDVSQARHFVHIEYYIFVLDETTEPLFSAIESARRRGVIVRVLYDAFGTRKFPRRKEMLARLRKCGAEVHAMLPLRLPGKFYTRPDLRNHRKLVVVDGEVGYTGSLNMVERAYHRKDSIVYDEMVVRLEGPIVLQLEAIFLTDWHSETGIILSEPRRNFEKQLVARGTSITQVIPSGPGYQYENNLKAFNGSFYQARSRITIVNPYFVPDESLQMALTNAALRGVEVVLVNSEAIDQRMVAHAQRSYYQEMLDAGVKIYLYKAPTLLHSKYILIDDDLLLVGSSNMDIRSFELNQELMLAVYDAKVVSQLETITLSYLKRSRRLTKKEWAQRSVGQRFLDSVARLTSSLQ